MRALAAPQLRWNLHGDWVGPLTHRAYPLARLCNASDIALNDAPS